MLNTCEMETSSPSSSEERDAFKDTSLPVTAGRELEASRYALLQRLTPGIRHQIAGAFQPITMLASSMQRLVQDPNVDQAKIAAHSASMHSFSRSGATFSLGCFSWLSADERVDIGVNEGVNGCLNLIATELALREFTIVNDLATCTETWPREALRSVFTAALLALADFAPSPAALVLSSESGDKGFALTLEARSADGAIVRELVPIYRKIEWLDVELLAEAEGVSLERTAGGARLSLLPGGG